jgi:hypothetical protein
MFDKAAKAITGAIEDLRGELAKINQQIAQLEDARRALVGGSRTTAKAVKKALGKRGPRKVKAVKVKAVKVKRGRRGMGPAARKAQSARMKAYWAARRKGKLAGKRGRKPGKVAAKVVKAKRNLSPEYRQQLSARMKAKWAAKRAERTAQ